MEKAFAEAVGDLHVSLAEAYGEAWCPGGDADSRALVEDLAKRLAGTPPPLLTSAALALRDDLLRPARPPELPVLRRWVEGLAVEYEACDEARALHRALQVTYGTRWTGLGGLPALYRALEEAGIEAAPEAFAAAREAWERDRDTVHRYRPPLPADLAALSARRCASDHALFRHFACGDPAPEPMGAREAAAGRAAAREVGSDRLRQMRALEAEAAFMIAFRRFLARPSEPKAERRPAPPDFQAEGDGQPLPPDRLADFLLRLADRLDGPA